LRRRGYTLIEVLVGGVLLTTVFFAILDILPGSLAGMRHAHNLLSASNLAQGVIEQVRATSFAQLASATLPDQMVDGTVYHMTMTVTTRSPRVTDVDITVSWDVTPAPPMSMPTSLTYHTSLYNFSNP